MRRIRRSRCWRRASIRTFAPISVSVRGLLDHEHREGATMLLNDAEVPRMIFAELRTRFK
jgi:hypothetical protein